MNIPSSLEPWHWVILFFLLLGVETLGAGGFLLGGATAALVVAGINWLLPSFGWAEQLAIFAALSLILTVAYWYFFQKVYDRDDLPDLNNRGAQLIGRYVELNEDLPYGQGKAQIGDTLWKVKVSSKKSLFKGTFVVVTGCQNMTLLIEEQLDKG
ncbi:MAG: NfeD family protein [Candidatus Endonucleobacter bathymodioli]|uniref:NfeD family protein n=1 Tax=Candidatus Endonucleibacter bathymodioli TaxID=539814 RepID=A0AA90NJQ2_9GAMM|nr:NfeD family protein [Candidatus Endonucleobacter bathymodioli]